MAHYIDKDALVAEIERLHEKHTSKEYRDEAALVLEDFEDFLDTLDVKEVGVDLGDPKGDKSAKHIIDTKTLEVKEVDLEKELIKWHKEHFKKDGTFIGMSGFYLTNNSQMDIAKHFYSLGLAQKGK